MSARIVTRHAIYRDGGVIEDIDRDIPESVDVIAITESGREVQVSVHGERIELYYEGRALVVVPSGGMNTLAIVPVPRGARDLLEGLGIA